MRGKVTAAAVPALIAALKSPDREVRYEIVSLLQSLGPDARAAIPALIRMLRESDTISYGYDIGSVAAMALGEFAPHTPSADDAVAALAAALRSESKRLAAINALSAFGPAARGAMPQLRALKEHDSNANVRRAAAKALAEIDSAASKE